MGQAPLGMRRTWSRIASWVCADHRYVFLATSALALVGMVLSSQVRPALSLLRPVFVVELVLYYVLLAWLLFAAAAGLTKAFRWHTYAETAWCVSPVGRLAARMGSYLVAGIVALFAFDRIVLGFVSAFIAALQASSRPDQPLESALYMLINGRGIYWGGILTTIQLAVFGTVIAFGLAVLLVFVRMQVIDRSDNDLVRFLKVVGVGFSKLYSTIVRGTPMLVQGFIIYYGGFALIKTTGMTTSEINAIWSMFVAGLVTVSLNSTAYMMEVIRGGIESVDKGQMEAARSLGLSQWQALSKVIFPQGIKHAIPGLSNELVINIKDSSALSVIGVFDLTFAATTNAGIYFKQLDNYLIAAVFYLALTMVATWLLGRFANRFNVKSAPVLGTSDLSVPVVNEG